MGKSTNRYQWVNPQHSDWAMECRKPCGPTPGAVPTVGDDRLPKNRWPNMSCNRAKADLARCLGKVHPGSTETRMNSNT